MDVEYNAAKLQELILYIVSRSQGEPNFGKMKLVNVLFYSDLAAYRELDVPITGAAYLHLELGAYPDGLENRKRILQTKGDISVVESHGRFKEELFYPKREPNIGLFSGEELRIVDRVIGELWPLDASQVSAKSQEEAGYRLTRPSEVIPYSTAVISNEPLAAEDIARGQELAAELGLLA